MPKLLIYILFLVLLVPADAATVDSTEIYKKLGSFEKLLGETNKAMIELKNNQGVIVNGMDSIVAGQKEMVVNFNASEKHSIAAIDTLKHYNQSILEKQQELNSKHKLQFIIFLLLQSITIIIVVFLIYTIVQLRKDSMSYLIAQAKSVEEQGDQIIDKANVLKTLNDELRTMISDKKKLKKSEIRDKRKTKKEKRGKSKK